MVDWKIIILSYKSTQQIPIWISHYIYNGYKNKTIDKFEFREEDSSLFYGLRSNKFKLGGVLNGFIWEVIGKISSKI